MAYDLDDETVLQDQSAVGHLLGRLIQDKAAGRLTARIEKQLDEAFLLPGEERKSLLKSEDSGTSDEG